MNNLTRFLALILSATCSYSGFAMQPQKLPPLSLSIPKAVQSRGPLLFLFGAVATGCAGVYNFNKNNKLTNEELDALCFPSDGAPRFLEQEVKNPAFDKLEKKENL